MSGKMFDFSKFARDARSRFTVEYREGNQAKSADFDNLHRAQDFFESCKSDPACIDIELWDNTTDRVLAHDRRRLAQDPPTSEAQRRAMFAAKAGKSNLGIPQKVGAEFAKADPGGKLPARKT